MGRAATLPDGIYEHPVTDELVRDLGDDDAPVVLARHLGKEAERVLGALPRTRIGLATST